MTTYIPDALRREVADRAAYRCEYCRVHQEDRLFAHEIDHIVAEKHGGQTHPEPDESQHAFCSSTASMPLIAAIH